MLLTELESERDDDDDDDRTICANGEKHRVQFVWRGREGGKMRRREREEKTENTNERKSLGQMRRVKDLYRYLLDTRYGRPNVNDNQEDTRR